MALRATCSRRPTRTSMAVAEQAGVADHVRHFTANGW